MSSYSEQISINPALERAGIELVQDLNDPTAPAACSGLVDLTLDSSSGRHSTYRAFLPAELVQERRSHLKVCTKALVSRVQLEEYEGGVRATGVFFRSASPGAARKEFFARAQKEVILCAGALVSPQILMLRYVSRLPLPKFPLLNLQTKNLQWLGAKGASSRKRRYCDPRSTCYRVISGAFWCRPCSLRFTNHHFSKTTSLYQ